VRFSLRRLIPALRGGNRARRRAGATRAAGPARLPGWFARLGYYLPPEGGGNGTGARAAPGTGLMLGHSHALSGGVAGLAAGIVLHLPIPQMGALAGFTAGMALLPDLDKCGSSPARSLGFVSEAVAWVFGRISGGHRHATHSFLGIAVFTALAWASCHFRADWGGKAGLALLMTLSVSAALEALHVARGHVADLAGIAVAAATVWYGYGLRFIPIAVLLGCATHITGDMLTDSGCMLGYPWSRYRFHLLPEPFAFTTGTLPELLIIDPILSGAVLALAVWIIDPAWLRAQWGT
jgi:membrane-bound metal-dependent hydrolase YbcI (DUF457 family)